MKYLLYLICCLFFFSCSDNSEPVKNHISLSKSKSFDYKIGDDVCEAERVVLALLTKKISTDLAQSYYKVGNSTIEEAEIVFLPESHIKIDNILHNYQLLFEFSDPVEDIFLTEHGSASENLTPMTINFEFHSTIQKLLALSDIASLNLKFSSYEDFVDVYEAKYDAIYRESLFKRNCPNLDMMAKFANERLNVNGWDCFPHKTERKLFRNMMENDYEYGPEDGNIKDPLNASKNDQLRFRNLSMIHFIKNSFAHNYKRVFIRTGYGHLPESDFLKHNSIRDYNPENMEKFFNNRKGLDENTTGTLYRYLKNKKYVIFLYKELLSQ